MKKLIILTLGTLLSFSSSADELYQESAVNLCQNLKQKTYSKKCIELVKENTYQENALSFCSNRRDWNKTKTCLIMIANNYYEEAPFALCTSGKFFDQKKQTCMKNIANKVYISPVEVNLCSEEKHYTKQIKCLKAAASKPYVESEVTEGLTDTQKLAALEEKVKAAYKLLGENKTADATILLHEAVTAVESK